MEIPNVFRVIALIMSVLFLLHALFLGVLRAPKLERVKNGRAATRAYRMAFLSMSGAYIWIVPAMLGP